MKITAIKTQNFIGARDVDVKLAKPICLFAGKNFSGKSSLQEAVRMALTGESVRVSLKKEYAQQRVLTRAGWVRIASFASSKTGEEVEIWGCEVAGRLL